MIIKKNRPILVTLLTIAVLQGCAAAAVIGIASTATIVNDRRTFGNQFDDQSIETKAALRIADSDILKKQTHINVTSLNGTVLVTGQAPTLGLKRQVVNTLKTIDGVAVIHDQIRIDSPSSIASRSKDTWLTTKIKAQLLASDKLDGTAIKVVTENSEVFLMGLVNAKEADKAVDIARNVTGVAKVYKAFEIR